MYWPYLLGSDPDELEALSSIDVCFFTGAITTDAERSMAEQLRAKSDVMVACGACAAFGGMPGLANIKNAFEPWDTETRLDPARHPLRAFDKELKPDPWQGDATRGKR